MKTDFGAPRKRKKSEGSPKLALKIKGEPKEVHRVLDRVSGAGDVKVPGPRGPRRMHHIPERKSSKRAPVLARPLGQMKGPRPTVNAQSYGVGDPPMISATRISVYKSPKPSEQPKSNNPESPKRKNMPGPKKIKPLGKPLSSVFMLKFGTPPEPPKAGGRARPVEAKMPPEMERAPTSKMIPLFTPRMKSGEERPRTLRAKTPKKRSKEE